HIIIFLIRVKPAPHNLLRKSFIFKSRVIFSNHLQQLTYLYTPGIEHIAVYEAVKLLHLLFRKRIEKAYKFGFFHFRFCVIFSSSQSLLVTGFVSFILPSSTPRASLSCFSIALNTFKVKEIKFLFPALRTSDILALPEKYFL